jgi:hypothetical protein
MDAPRRLYLVVNQQPVGPFTELEVAGKLLAGEINEQTPSCVEGAQDWSDLHRTLSPELMRQTLEYRRASVMFNAAVSSPNPPAPTSLPNRSFVGSTSMIGPAAAMPARPIPAVSFVESSGATIQVPGSFQMSGGIATSPPAPHTPTVAAPMGQSYLIGAQPPPAAPAANVAPAEMGLALEAEGAESSATSKSKVWMIGAGLAAVLAIAGSLAYAPGKRWWDAREAFARGTAALQSGQLPEAMIALHTASHLQPDSGVYVTALQDARRRFVDRIKERGTDEPALSHLAFVRSSTSTYETSLGEDALQVLKDWAREIEPNANQQIRQAFDQPLERLQELLAPHEGKLRSYFAAPAEREEAGRLHDQWRTLRESYAAWDRGEWVAAVKELSKINDDLRKSAFTTLHSKTEALRGELEGKLRKADELAGGSRFMETRPVFAALEPYVDLVPSITLERKRIQLAGENYYASTLVGAVRAKNETQAEESLRNYMEFRGTPLAAEQIAAFLHTSEFKPFIDRLREFGLHPATPDARQHYADVILVASTLPNFADVAPAREFLRDAYYKWGAQELDKGRAAPAAYLALLAQKYNSAEAETLFEKARAKISSSFTIAVQPAPITVNAPKAPRSLAADLEASALTNLRGGLPDWIRWQSEAPAQGSEALITIRATPVLAQFNRRSEQTSRTARSRFRFDDIVEDNPAWYQAQEMVAHAEGQLERARNAYDQAKAAADQTMQQSANSDGGNLALLGAMISGVSKGVSSANVDSATSELAQARGVAASTPRQIRKENIQDVEWNEIDHVNLFDTEFRLDLILGDKVLQTRKFVAGLQHTSTERAGGYGGRVTPIQRQEPSLEAVETGLASELKAQLRVIGTNEFLNQIKTALANHILLQAKDMDAETHTDTLLSLELLWWKHPLFSSNAMRTPELLGRFGDVVEN